MDPADIEVLDEYLMPARLAPYLRACGNDPGRARRLYVWNIEVSAAFWGSISGVEIALRNAIHQAFAREFAREDWWHHPRMRDDDVVAAVKAEGFLRRQRARIPSAPSVSADDVVAELSLGFWANLLQGPSRSFEQDKYWHGWLHRAFPNWNYEPGAESRKVFTRRIERLRKFRNRVAHHEPVHHRDLTADHHRIIDIAGLMHTDLASFIAEHSRVPQAIARREDAVDRGLCQF